MKASSTAVACAFFLTGMKFFSSAAVGVAQPEFTSRVYFLIHEKTPFQIQRSRKKIESEFAQTVESIPQLQNSPYQVITDGNEVVFLMASTAAMQIPFQAAVYETVSRLNDEVSTRGRYDFLRTSFEAPTDTSLEVILNESSTRIRSIVAKSITLRDLLSELKMQFEEAYVRNRIAGVRNSEIPRFSYLFPGDCGVQPVDWSFGSRSGDPFSKEGTPEERAKEKTLDEALKEVAKVFKLTVENHQGTYIFTGECPRVAQTSKRPSSPMELLPSHWIPLKENPFNAPPTAPTLRVNFSE